MLFFYYCCYLYIYIFYIFILKSKANQIIKNENDNIKTLLYINTLIIIFNNFRILLILKN